MHAKTIQDIETNKKAIERSKKIAILIHQSIQKVKNVINNRVIITARYNKYQRLWFWAYERVRTNLAITKTAKMLQSYYRSQLPTTKLDNTKLLYDGSKLFWRLQFSIELHMYLHDGDDIKAAMPEKSPVLEVIGYDITHQKELLRLYLNYKLIQIHIKERIVEPIVSTFVSPTSNGGPTGPKENTPTIVDAKFIAEYDLDALNPNETRMMNNIITEYIASKLDIQLHPYHSSHYMLTLGPLDHDKFDKLSATSTFAPLPPDLLVDEAMILKHMKPVEILRRRKTTEAERSSAFADYTKHKNDLMSLTTRAAEHIVRNNGTKQRLDEMKSGEAEDLDEMTAKMQQLLTDFKKPGANVDVAGGPEQSTALAKRSPGRTKGQSRTFDGMSTVSSRTRAIKKDTPSVSPKPIPETRKTASVLRDPVEVTDIRASLTKLDARPRDKESVPLLAKPTKIITPRSATLSRSGKLSPHSPICVEQVQRRQKEEAASLKELIQASPRAAASLANKQQTHEGIAPSVSATVPTLHIASPGGSPREESVTSPEKLVEDYFKKVDESPVKEIVPTPSAPLAGTIPGSARLDTLGSMRKSGSSDPLASARRQEGGFGGGGGGSGRKAVKEEKMDMEREISSRRNASSRLANKM